MRKALITGVSGQDGSYLAELLMAKGYEVHGIVRRSSTFNWGRIDHLNREGHGFPGTLHLHYGDLIDTTSLTNLLEKTQPDELYNLAAQSHVKISFDLPEYTAQVDALGTLKVLDAIRNLGLKTKFYQASTSELYGKVQEIPQSEKTPFYPRSPYGVAKLYSYWLTVNYRESYGMFASNGILFNHESPRRGENFVSRKITMAIASIKLGTVDRISLGNLDAERDWGYAPEYVEGMWRMLQQDSPDDFVLATGKCHSVRRFANLAFARAGYRLEWQGKGPDEIGVDAKTGKVLVDIDPKYYRPAEVDLLKGDPTKAKKLLGWEAKTTLEELVDLMVDGDMSLMSRAHQAGLRPTY